MPGKAQYHSFLFWIISYLEKSYLNILNNTNLLKNLLLNKTISSWWYGRHLIYFLPTGTEALSKCPQIQSDAQGKRW